MPDTSCPFCAIVSGSAAARVVYRSDTAIGFFPRAPEALGHTVICPTAHVAELADASDAMLAELVRVAKLIVTRYGERLGSAGANLLMASGACAQQSVAHLHLHVIPRFPDDGIDAWPRLPGSTHDLDELARRVRVS